MKFVRNSNDCDAPGFRWHIEWTKRFKALCFWLPHSIRHPSRPLIYFWRF